MVGEFLPPQIIYKGKTNRCHPHYNFPSDWSITHSPNHWSTEETTLQYINQIIIPYFDKKRECFGEIDKMGLVIYDNFKGQITKKVLSLLDENNVGVLMLPPNTTDRLQPMDISVNKAIKECLKKKFDDWYSSMVQEQLQGKNMDELEAATITPIDLSLGTMKHVGAKWLLEAVDYISANPSIIVNGFIASGITEAADAAVKE